MMEKVQSKLDRQIADILESPLDTAKHKLTYKKFLTDKLLIIKMIRQGVPYSLFSLIKDAAPFTESDWAELLDLSIKTLHRYKQASKHFQPLQSEKIIEMAEVTKVGIEVFGDMEKFKLWLNTPNFALASHKPIELLKDSYGKEMVIGELIRIDHGIFV